MTAQSTQQETKTTTLAGWKKNKRHTVTLPSSTKVEIELPDLPDLIKTGSIPNELIDIAIGAAQGKKITREDIIEQVAFTDKLVILTVKAPEVTEQDVKELPFEDKEMLVEFATRQRDMDAVGHQLGGLEKVKDFRTFRSLPVGIEDLVST